MDPKQTPTPDPEPQPDDAVEVETPPKPDPEPQTKAKKAKKAKARIERYLFTKPDGTVVTIEHDIDAGTTKVIDSRPDEAEEVDLEKLSKKQLEELATDNDIDLSDARTNADRIEIIAAAYEEFNAKTEDED